MNAIAKILSRRAAIAAEIEEIEAKHPDGQVPAEIATRSAELLAEAEALNNQERRQAFINDLDRRATGQAIGAGDGGDQAFEALARQVTALDVIRAQMGATDAAAGRAREVSAELEKRSGRAATGLLFSLSLSGAPPERRVFTTTAPAGGPGSNLIATDVSPNLIDRLREKIVVRSMGATVLGGLVGNLSMPRLKASATAQWVAENSAITASDPQTDAVPLSPKTVGGIVEISRNMILQPSLDVARLVENDLAALIATAFDRVAIQGGGTAEPKGLLAAGSGITVVGIAAAGGPPTWDSIVNLIAAVDVSNALDGSLGFVTNGKVVSKLRRTLRSTADTASTFIMSDAATLIGYRLASTQLVPSDLVKSTGTALSALIFGNWAQLVLGFWSELDLLVNPYESAAYAKGNVQIRAMATGDVAIRQPAGFAAITDMVTT